jgi:uncharacterized protein (DUF486 family)
LRRCSKAAGEEGWLNPILPAKGKIRFVEGAMAVVALLLTSNLFMTTAWYWHLKGGMDRPLPLVILISWGIALFEYCLAVPANRIGFLHGWSGAQLKIVQEAIALIVFGGFMVAVLGEPLGWRHLGAFLCVLGALAFLFAGR